MKYRNEVHVYPAIDTVLQRLVVAIVGYDTEHCFDDWLDESNLQLTSDVGDTGDTIDYRRRPLRRHSERH